MGVVNSIIIIIIIQGWARDLEARDRDETETSGPETETRPRRLIICPRRDEIETLIIRDETRPRPSIRLETVSRPRRRDRDAEIDSATLAFDYLSFK